MYESTYFGHLTETRTLRKEPQGSSTFIVLVRCIQYAQCTDA